MERELEPRLCADRVPGMSLNPVAGFEQPEKRKIKGMPELLSAQDNTIVAWKETNGGKAEMRKPKRSWISQLWSKRYKVRFSKCDGSGTLSDKNFRGRGQESGARQNRHERELCSGEHQARRPQDQLCKSAQKCTELIRTEVLALRSDCCNEETVIWNVKEGNNRRCQERSSRETEALAHNRCTARLYDIRNAGKHHRFTVSGHLVHNCGYGGGVGALKAMGALDMGLKEEELKPLVDSWREASPNIVKFWWNVDEAVKKAIKDRIETETNGLLFEYKSGMLFITLPSGRHLSYVKPKIEANQWGGESVTYEGVGTTKKWERIESYGPKFVENCLAVGTRVITNKGLVPLESITSDMLIWDGEEYVHHNGLIYQGEKNVISVNGIEMTPEHKILTDKGWKKAEDSADLIWAGTNLKVSIYPCSDIKSVYDIRNCGPRHRFAVWNGTSALIVSNCVQAISRDILCAAMTRMQKAGISTVAHIHDETVNEVPMDMKVDEITSLMSISPEWMKDINLTAAGYECAFYMKD